MQMMVEQRRARCLLRRQGLSPQQRLGTSVIKERLRDAARHAVVKQRGRMAGQLEGGRRLLRSEDVGERERARMMLVEVMRLEGRV